jgi:hypothetical protein
MIVIVLNCSHYDHHDYYHRNPFQKMQKSVFTQSKNRDAKQKHRFSRSKLGQWVNHPPRATPKTPSAEGLLHLTGLGDDLRHVHNLFLDAGRGELAVFAPAVEKMCLHS